MMARHRRKHRCEHESLKKNPSRSGFQRTDSKQNDADRHQKRRDEGCDDPNRHPRLAKRRADNRRRSRANSTRLPMGTYPYESAPIPGKVHRD